MRYSQLLGKTVKTPPADAQLISHQLLIRGGFIDRALASGVYSYLTLGWRVFQKIANIIREEMAAIDGQEIFLPTLNPRELWQESGRWQAFKPPLFKTQDQHGRKFCLAPTHEEVITDLCRRLVHSYRNLPKAVFQIQNKFRNEARSTGGLLRAREFMMKDLYSFHQDKKDLNQYYPKVYQAYEKIFKRCGLDAKAVEASSGSIGGSFCHEFMLFSPDGEDKVAVCRRCDYRANLEKAAGNLKNKNPQEKEQPLKMVKAVRGPNMKAMSDFYRLPAWRMLKTIIYLVKDKPVAVLIRGDLEINETKLENIFQTDDFRIPEPAELKNFKTVRGFVAPIGLKVNRFLVDRSVLTVKNLITGANKLNFDFKNFNCSRDLKEKEIVDIAVVNNDFYCPKCKQAKLTIKSAIELGHIFKLGIKYSQAMKAEYLDERGQKQLVWMGCYGIGLGRLLAAIVEAHHDQKGIIWPASVAPFQVHLIAIYNSQSAIKKFAEKIYQKLLQAGIEVLYDDRQNVSAGEKFANADLIGIPIRLVISPKTKNKIEWKARNSRKALILPLAKILQRL